MRSRKWSMALTATIAALGIATGAAAIKAEVGARPSTSSKGIRSVDFRNFNYPSGCSKKIGDGSHALIHVTDGTWSDEPLEQAKPVKFKVVKVLYGDVKGDGHEEAVVQTSCGRGTRFEYDEVFVFEMAGGVPELVGRLSPSDWGERVHSHNPRVGILLGGEYAITKLRVGGGSLAVSFVEEGGPRCPDLHVKAAFRWDGTLFVRNGISWCRGPSPARGEGKLASKEN